MTGDTSCSSTALIATRKELGIRLQRLLDLSINGQHDVTSGCVQELKSSERETSLLAVQHSAGCPVGTQR